MLDVHTMTLGALCTLLSCQMFWMWVHAKIHGWVSGILPPDAFTRAFSRLFTLERGVATGAALLLVGLACDLWVVAEWYARDLGVLEVRTTLRFALWGLTAMVLGAQTVSGSFLASMQCMGSRAGCPRSANPNTVELAVTYAEETASKTLPPDEGGIQGSLG